jgi:hypothetical protein
VGPELKNHRPETKNIKLIYSLRFEITYAPVVLRKPPALFHLSISDPLPLSPLSSRDSHRLPIPNSPVTVAGRPRLATDAPPRNQRFLLSLSYGVEASSRCPTANPSACSGKLRFVTSMVALGTSPTPPSSGTRSRHRRRPPAPTEAGAPPG